MVDKCNKGILKASAEIRYCSELDLLKKLDKSLRPQGWKLSPQAVRRFIIGDPDVGIEGKFL